MSDKKNSRKDNTTARRNEILEYLLNFGPFGIPIGTQKEFAEKWECDVRTIRRDVDYVITHTKIPKMQKMGQKFLLGYEKAMKVVAQMLQDEDPDTRMKGVTAFNQTQDHYTKMCENYRFKEKIAENLNISAKETIFNLIVKSEEEIKRDKLDNQPKAA